MGACDWSSDRDEPGKGVHHSEKDPEGTIKASAILGLFQTTENHQVASLAGQPWTAAT